MASVERAFAGSAFSTRLPENAGGTAGFCAQEQPCSRRKERGGKDGFGTEGCPVDAQVSRQIKAERGSG